MTAEGRAEALVLAQELFALDDVTTIQGEP